LVCSFPRLLGPHCCCFSRVWALPPSSLLVCNPNRAGSITDSLRGRTIFPFSAPGPRSHQRTSRLYMSFFSLWFFQRTMNCCFSSLPSPFFFFLSGDFVHVSPPPHFDAPPRRLIMQDTPALVTGSKELRFLQFLLPLSLRVQLLVGLIISFVPTVTKGLREPCPLVLPILPSRFFNSLRPVLVGPS